MIFWAWVIVSAGLLFVAFKIHDHYQPDFWQKPWKRGWRIEK